MDSNLIQLAFNLDDDNIILADYLMQGQGTTIFKTYVNGDGNGYGNGYENIIL